MKLFVVTALAVTVSCGLAMSVFKQNEQVVERIPRVSLIIRDLEHGGTYVEPYPTMEGCRAEQPRTAAHIEREHEYVFPEPAIVVRMRRASLACVQTHVDRVTRPAGADRLRQ